MKFIILNFKTKFIIIIYTTNKLTIVEMEDVRGVRLRKFKLRKIILGVRMHFRHIFPGQDKAVPSFGEAAEEWKPPDKIYTIDNTINTILRYVLGFFFFILFPPSTSLSLLFILFSSIRVLFS